MAEVEEIQEYLKTSKVQKKNFLNSLMVFLVSVIMFIGLELIDSSFKNIIILVFVIFIHEVGHYIGMKIFGYRNMQIFFIPMLGAATSGHKVNSSDAREAIIRLLGPLPGIFIGIICWLMYFKTKNDIYIQPARIFLLINAFNLLPFSPLDGGCFFDTLIFSRSPKLEIVFKLTTGLLLLGLAILLKLYLLVVFFIYILLSLKIAYIRASAAKQVRLELRKDNQADKPAISKEWIARIVGLLRKDKIFSNQKIDVLAVNVQDIWQRACTKRSGAAAIFGLIMLYLVSISVAVASPIAFELRLAISQCEKKIEVFTKEDGTQGRRAAVYLRGRPHHMVELAPDNLYDGKNERYFFDTGILKQRGYWYRGKWDGEWSTFNMSGNIIAVIKFDKGSFVSRRYLTKQGWVENDFDSLPRILQQEYKKHEMSAPIGINENWVHEKFDPRSKMDRYYAQ